MAVFKTTQGQSVDHFHIGDPDFYDNDLDAQGIAKARAIVAGFDSAVEIDDPTRRFNCHGFAYTHSHGWFNVAKPFIDDDVTQIPFADARPGDIVSYRKGGRLKHSGVVEQVTNGVITKVRSKWGSLATVVHDLDDVHPVFGAAEILRRPNGGIP